MKPYLSIIIPYFNSYDVLTRLFASVTRSKNIPSCEVIIVDDGSEENIKYQISNIKYQIYADGIEHARQRRHKPKIKNPTSGFHLPTSTKGKGGDRELSEIPMKVIRLDRNMGPAVARNRGAKVARGEFLVFLDSDVELFPDTLHNIASVFRDDPDVVALTGVWVKEQKSSAFFPNFKALRDWSYWINERDKSGYYFLFSTRIASIKRSVFLRLGGFNEEYPAPLVEDIELTYRIARRYAIIFAPQVRVRHEFEGFWPIAKKYFLRAYYWTKLYQRRKKFDPVATTWQEALTTVSGVGVVASGLLSLAALPSLPLILSVRWQAPPLWYQLSLLNFEFFVIFLVLHILLIRTFLVFVYREKGLSFALKSFFVGLILYCFIFAGALWGRVKA